jgi:lactoylglutathione lyase
MSKRVVLIAAVCAAIVAGVVLTWQPSVGADKADSAFARTTIDLGVVVSDIDKSAKFYTEVVGFKEVKGFEVSGPFAADAGLTDGKPLAIRVFALGDDPSATKLKLMQIKGADPKKSSNDFIHSQTGFRYLTIFINDTNAALARMKKADVKALGKGTNEIPADIAPGMFLTIIRDPDGNFVELVGPKK